jgi:hypothetical protein
MYKRPAVELPPFGDLDLDIYMIIDRNFNKVPISDVPSSGILKHYKHHVHSTNMDTGWRE